jgi:hypothetical protein
MTKAVVTLVGAAGAGALIWVATQFDAGTTRGYWAELGVLAGAALVFALMRLVGPRGMGRLAPSPPTFLVAFLPVLVAAGWVLVAAQPHGNWFRGHVREWSGDIGISGVVDDLSGVATVLAFGIGLTFGFCFDRVVARVSAPAEPAPPVEAAPPTAETRPLDRDRELVRSGRSND